MRHKQPYIHHVLDGSEYTTGINYIDVEVIYIE